MGNHLYYGDNLAVLRESIADESVDLIYLDPPFNSNASYNVLFKGPHGNESAAQIEAFDDTWHWTDAAEEAFGEVLRSGNGAAAEMLRAMRSFLGENDMMAYLAMMAVRLLELHRVLKPTGSLYLHCDPTASHYLKILLDAVFGARCFKNEIDWKRTTTHSDAKTWSNNADCILFYAKSEKGFIWNTPREPHSEEYVKSKYGRDDKDGRGPYHLDNMTSPSPRPKMMYEWKGFPFPEKGWRYQHETMQRLHDEGRIWYPTTETGEMDHSKRPRLKRYLNEMEGGVMGDIWTDIPPLNSQAKERLGYPTQKPVALLERILSASSNEGDVVLDPFCGCGTTVHAAEKLGRNWIGIDVTHLAIGLIEKRLRDAFPKVEFTTHGVPQDISGARDMANRGRTDKNYYFEFEKWALSLINAQPGNMGKKGADKGIDGNIYFGKTDRAIVSVKAGDNIGVGMIRDLRGVIEREKAEIGIFLTLTEPKKTMVAEAAAAGQFQMEGFEPVPRIQIVTIEEALNLRDRAVRLPARRDDTFKKAAREEDRTAQGKLDL
ncbi:site-specific DNA-methyltransferase [Roseovarius aestuariivivens]|uniref:site-specific DNA-methyltransferase n=1 Tax=Roseovarius aestuariivivens TaxID=1888910 RepID=UPI00108021E7|nr:DNA methyltransferase [Roseovarius aestuariivivens]